MSDLILGGINITELRKQQQVLRKEGSVYIAEGIRDATALIESILGADEESTKEEIDEAAEKATEILKNIRIVSGVTGVEYFLPHATSYGDYYDEKPFTIALESADLEFSPYSATDALGRLYSVLEDMESTVRDWNTSYC